MESIFHQGSWTLQDRFDTRRLADRIERRLVRHEIGEADRQLIEGLDMFFLATADDEGRPSCSFKGGAPGFVRVLDPRTIAFPSYDGNGMFLSMGNLARNPSVGMLFIDFERATRMRLGGSASMDEHDPLLADYPEAQLVVRVHVREVFPNCSRYIPRMARTERSPFVPEPGRQTPVPRWKRATWAHDALPEDDPARDPSRRAR